MPIRRFGLILFACCLLVSCGFPAGLLLRPPSGVAANIQAGETNNQTIGTTSMVKQSARGATAETIRQSADRNHVSAQTVETVIVQETTEQELVLMGLLLLLDSPTRWPGQIWRSVIALWSRFRRKVSG